MSAHRFLRRFKRDRVLLPVVHCCNPLQARTAASVAIEQGADGVWLINQGGMSRSEVAACAADVARDGAPFVGVNLLGVLPEDAMLAHLGAHEPITGLWTDDAGVRLHDAALTADFEQRFTRSRAHYGRDWMLYFGGVAFKYTEEVPIEKLGAVAQRAARWVDVVTTSGPATGTAPPVEKMVAMRAALGDHPLAIASGITPDNVMQFLDTTNAFLVASGIESDFGVFDPGRARDLAQAIHSYQTQEA